jgi:hypothetical protein
VLISEAAPRSPRLRVWKAEHSQVRSYRVISYLSTYRRGYSVPAWNSYYLPLTNYLQLQKKTVRTGGKSAHNISIQHKAFLKRKQKKKRPRKPQMQRTSSRLYGSTGSSPPPPQPPQAHQHHHGSLLLERSKQWTMTLLPAPATADSRKSRRHWNLRQRQETKTVALCGPATGGSMTCNSCSAVLCATENKDFLLTSKRNQFFLCSRGKKSLLPTPMFLLH